MLEYVEGHLLVDSVARVSNKPRKFRILSDRLFGYGCMECSVPAWQEDNIHTFTSIDDKEDKRRAV